LPQEPETVQHATTTPSDEVDTNVKQTSWPMIPLPRVTMPQISMPDMSPITSPVKSGFGKLSSGTKKAWEGTKEMFSWGRSDASQQARAAEPEESIWSRMFGTAPKEPNGPQTVGEWMAQPR